MGGFEAKDGSVKKPRPAIPMGPSLNPPPRSRRQEASQPVMTFRPPGATPISIPSDSEPDASRTMAAQTAMARKPDKSGGSKVALIVVGVMALAAAGVAAGWFFTQ